MLYIQHYLLYGVEVLVVEVSKEPEDTRPEDLSQEHHKGGQIEDEDHSSQPVQECYCTYTSHIHSIAHTHAIAMSCDRHCTQPTTEHSAFNIETSS